MLINIALYSKRYHRGERMPESLNRPKPCEMNGTLIKIHFILYRGVIIDQ